MDDGPFKEFRLRAQTQQSFPVAFEVGFSKRPLEELYDVRADPHQMQNLANSPEHKDAKELLWQRLRNYLKDTSAPRIDGRDPWQSYIYRQVDGFGATFNLSLSEAERAAARERGKHQVSPGAKE